MSSSSTFSIMALSQTVHMLFACDFIMKAEKHPPRLLQSSNSKSKIRIAAKALF